MAGGFVFEQAVLGQSWSLSWVGIITFSLE